MADPTDDFNQNNPQDPAVPPAPQDGSIPPAPVDPQGALSVDHPAEPVVGNGFDIAPPAGTPPVPPVPEDPVPGPDTPEDPAPPQGPAVG